MRARCVLAALAALAAYFAYFYTFTCLSRADQQVTAPKDLTWRLRVKFGQIALKQGDLDLGRPPGIWAGLYGLTPAIPYMATLPICWRQEDWNQAQADDGDGQRSGNNITGP